MSTLAILSEGLVVCALAVDLRLTRRLDKYMVWGVAIVAGAKVHDKQSQADNNSSNIYHHLPPNVDLNRCRLQRCLTTGHLLAELLANVAYYKLLFAWPGMVWSAADTFARRPAALYYSFK